MRAFATTNQTVAEQYEANLTYPNYLFYMAGDKIDISAVLAHPRGPIKEPANTSTR